MKRPSQPPAELVERHTVPGGVQESRALFLERAEYVSPDYGRRMLLEFDWGRAAADLPPWRVRLYSAKPHETSPNGIAWRLARRATWSPSMRQATEDSKPWMMGTGPAHRRIVRRFSRRASA